MVDITPIAEAIITIIVTIVGAFVIPMIKRKIGAEKLTKILKYIEVFVAAAEQLFDKTACEAKKQYVLDKIAEKGFKIEPEILDAEIEAAVLYLHNMLKESISAE